MNFEKTATEVAKGELPKMVKRSHSLMFSLSEIDMYTDKMVGKVLTLLETLIIDDKRLESVKSVARDYLYEINKDLHGHVNDWISGNVVKFKDGTPDYSLPYIITKGSIGIDKEVNKQRAKVIAEINK